MPSVTTKAIEQAIVRLLRDRAPRTACPSEVARALEPSRWRSLMQAVRDAAGSLAARGAIVVTQRGRVVDVRDVRGPVRFALVPGSRASATTSGPEAGAHRNSRAAAARTKRPKRRGGERSVSKRRPEGPAASDAWRGIDFRAHPDRYRVGRGEQGVLTAEPYKSELLPLWRFRTPEIARESARALVRAFRAYERAGDFVGMDMARKFLQMGYTRSRRYANHASGRKYGDDGEVLARDVDPVKATSAQIFYDAWKAVEEAPSYKAWRAEQRPTRRPR